MSQCICKFSNKCPVNSGGAGTCDRSKLHDGSSSCVGFCPNAICVDVEEIVFEEDVEVWCSDREHCVGGGCVHKIPHNLGKWCAPNECTRAGKSVCCIPVGEIKTKASVSPVVSLSPPPRTLKWVCEPKDGPSGVGFEVEGSGVIEVLKKALEDLGWKLVRK